MAMMSAAAKNAVKSVLVPIAHGTEEVEASTIITGLRRAGAKVCVASVESDLKIKGARGLHLCADELISASSVHDTQYDAIVLPGGAMGAEHLRDSPVLISMLKQQAKRKALYGAICASPAVALATHGLIHDKAVGHPSFYDRLVSSSGKHLASSAADLFPNGPRVVYDKEHNLITSLGPGSALEFALSLVTLLYGEEKTKEVASPMCLNFTPAKL